MLYSIQTLTLRRSVALNVWSPSLESALAQTVYTLL